MNISNIETEVLTTQGPNIHCTEIFETSRMSVIIRLTEICSSKMETKLLQCASLHVHLDKFQDLH